MILNRKLNSGRKSINKLKRKANNISIKKSRRNQKGGNYFLSVDQPKIGGLSEVQYQDDLYAPNVHIANLNPDLKLSHNNCIKGGSKRNKKYNKKGGNGNFNPDMNTRTFNCKQPFWSENCI